MAEIEISVRRTERVADLAKRVRRITEMPVHEIAAAASGQNPLFRGDLLGQNSADVQEKVLALMQRLSDGNFAFWIALDGIPTDRSTIENMIRSSHAIHHEQVLQGFLEAEESNIADRFSLHAELLLGKRWPLWLAIGCVALAVLVLFVLRGSAG